MKILTFGQPFWLQSQRLAIECVFPFSVVDASFVGLPREKGQTSQHRIKVVASLSLIVSWGFPVSRNELPESAIFNLRKVLFEYCREYLIEKLSKTGKLESDETLNLDTSKAETPCPFNPASIQDPIGAKIKVDIVNGSEAQTPAIINILFLASEPTNLSRIRVGEELREIQEKLQLAKHRDRFNLEQRMSVRPTDISQVLLDVEARVVHFSGHGTSSGELCFENQEGQVQPVSPKALAALFEQFSNQVECVLLNACYSETQAKAIAEHINYVIGMNKEIGDKAAIAFAVGFYQALGAGREIEDAYKLGNAQIMLQGIPEHLTPTLIKKSEIAR